ncbi:MAG: transglycosylase domain-containing protein, partial [Pedobacter sp.]|nr:transglycosylase domain-containing protein [Pedobacter sp.]
MGTGYKIKPYLGDIIIGILLCWFLFALPAKLFVSPTSFVVEANNGTLLSAAIARDGQWRFPVADSVPDKFAKCIMAFEDKRFEQHPGIDLLAMSRAMRQNISAKG